jgi:hypothetical protein
MLTSNVSTWTARAGRPASPPDLDAAADPLSGLEDIDWGRLGHAYGLADDLPHLLRGLQSDAAERREECFAELFGTIWHQGRVYEAAAHTVPFLLALLADRRTPDRLGVLHLLGALASGGPALSEQQRHDRAFDWAAFLASQGRDFDSELRRAERHARAANLAVTQGAGLLLRLAGDPLQSIEMARQALYTLALLPAAAPVSVPRLLGWLDAPALAELRPDITRALDRLLDDSGEARALFRGLLAREDDPAAACLAALALVRRAGAGAPHTAVELLLAALAELAQPPEPQPPRGPVGYWFWDTPWPERGLDLVLEHLLALEGEVARAALLRALPLLRQPEPSEQVARRLLDLVFFEGAARPWVKVIGWRQGRTLITYRSAARTPRRGPSGLSAAQRQVLIALLNHRPFWQIDTNLLRLYGLPAAHGALRAALDRG